MSPIDFTERSIGSPLLSVIKAICRLYVLFVVQIRNGMSIHKFQEMSISGKMMYRSTSLTVANRIWFLIYFLQKRIRHINLMSGFIFRLLLKFGCIILINSCVRLGQNFVVASHCIFLSNRQWDNRLSRIFDNDVTENERHRLGRGIAGGLPSVR